MTDMRIAGVSTIWGAGGRAARAARAGGAGGARAGSDQPVRRLAIIGNATYREYGTTEEVSDMARWRTRQASPAGVVALVLLAVFLVAAIPGALLVGLILMLLGHVLVGLAFAGGSVVVAVAAVALAGLSGKRYVRRLAESMGLRVVRLNTDDFTHRDDYGHPTVMISGSQDVGDQHLR
jgi:hypothetical protein